MITLFATAAHQRLPEAGETHPACFRSAGRADLESNESDGDQQIAAAPSTAAGIVKRKKRRPPTNKRRVFTAEDYERERKRTVEVRLVHLRDELEESELYVHSKSSVLQFHP